MDSASFLIIISLFIFNSSPFIWRRYYYYAHHAKGFNWYPRYSFSRFNFHHHYSTRLILIFVIQQFDLTILSEFFGISASELDSSIQAFIRRKSTF